MRLLFFFTLKKIEFIRSVGNLSQVPKDNLPEIVLCGRSNVGKSSFINSLFNKKNVAKTSSTPGKTRTLNYYLVENKFYIVDLPGFGYAKVSKTERDSWQRLIENYLNSSRNIEYAFHFIDSRHSPTQLDILLNRLLRELEIPTVTILSKIDKPKQSQLAKTKKEIKEAFPELIENENLFYYSSITGKGKKEIVNIVTKLFLS
ncbi:MAG: ribosome biogenesis GTP-binding protein YihA/YsxC [Melioribacteraceae bacterium]|nr:ribosome biogenesis GTP-binding protein YihA/YsxC [Melioribacteraceae bacterium]MCO6474554.1 YihA family ribosome biogenesis GTP-binding protein [Melioribacteraceae bacterium]MDD3557019.1 ribosome biogenesis GTP-binding protein YihA/YsxC [Melioribacteraceae bacterium]